MKFFETDGLKDTKLSPKGSVPIFLTDDYEVLEAPTYWAMDLTKTRSHSIETLKQYTSILARYLQWRDDNNYKAENWQYVTDDKINEYIGFLIKNRDENGRPNNTTIEFYIARLQSFYAWADKNGYKHYWKMDSEKVEYTLKNRSMVDISIERDARKFKLQNGKSTHVDAERDKFIHRENIATVLKLFDDPVYAIIAFLIWSTGLRPMELFQLPYMGTGLNSGLKRYREDELNKLTDILYDFDSKGKRRSIKFPAYLWAFICRVWMPKRAERAALYREKYGVMPPNSALFLSREGKIVTRKMLRDHLSDVTKKEECPEKKLTPYMFRHAFATYFVLDALKHNNLLGKAYAYNAVIDQELRERMGHATSDTTYKFYVHLVNRYFHNDLFEDLTSPENKEIFDAISKL